MKSSSGSTQLTSPVSPPILALTLSRRCVGPEGRGLEEICSEKEGSGVRTQLGVPTTRTLTSHVTSGKSSNLSGSHFLICKMGIAL